MEYKHSENCSLLIGFKGLKNLELSIFAFKMNGNE